MKNFTSIIVPKKYHRMIDEVSFEQGEGYWVYTNPGFCIDDFACHTGHEMMQKDLLKKIRHIEPCDCDSCLMQLNATPK